MNSFNQNKRLDTDENGFLKDHTTWTKEIAEQLAAIEKITLTDVHWEIINAVQHFYQEFDRSPAMRPFIKFLKLTVNSEINSIYLLKLFPQSPAKISSKIAGLPKPENCL